MKKDKNWLWLENAVLAAAFSAAVIYALSIPTVQVSNATHKCVKVVPDSAGTCENLPAKYERVWVK